MEKPIELNYFGTSLDCAGHYFWIAKGDRLTSTKVYFKDLPFDPESMFDPYTSKGIVNYYEVEDYKICAIQGSCFDKRNGSKSVFWTKENIELKHFKSVILSIPILNKMIKQMPFEVHFDTKPKYELQIK